MRKLLLGLTALSLTCICAAIVIKRTYRFEELIGVWQGSEITENGSNHSSEWTAYHNEDASLEILFVVTEAEKTYRFKHYGTWGVDKDIYFSHITKIVSEDQTEEEANYHFSYKIHSLTPDTFKYSTVDTGESYISNRVR